ncbi:hypothetical protein BH10ACT1_BH10ACT1_11680 [soil metagenome]
MAGERDDHDDRIGDAIRELAGDDRRLDVPPPELWGRIAGALDGATHAGEELAPPPPELWEHIAAEVRDLGGQPDAPAAPAGSSPAVGRPFRRRLVAAVAAAAVVLVVAALVAVRIGSDGGGSPVEVVAQASLSGQGLDPGGSSTGTARLVREDGTWEVAVRAPDLPPPAAGTYYEAWLLGSGPDEVQSLGALDGSKGFAVPGDLDLKRFPLVDVSIEPIDGNPAHSAKSVLRGRLEPT